MGIQTNWKTLTNCWQAKPRPSSFETRPQKDQDFQTVKTFIQTGWPENPTGLKLTVTPYYHIRDELATHEGLVFRGDRLVIPESLRKQILSERHSAHQGLESILRRARETIYWPHLNRELKDYISRCETCDTYNYRQPKQPLVTHDTPERAWAKVGCHLFAFNEKSYLATVDYCSNFFEFDRLNQLTLKDVIKKLKPHFARCGIPDSVVTDNGLQFISEEFQKFPTKNGFEHIRTCSYHHQSCGKAESAVKQAKRIVRACKAFGDEPYLALLTVRNTPPSTHGSSPARRLLNCRTKAWLPISEKLLKLKTSRRAAERIRRRQELLKKYYNRGAKVLRPLKEGDGVRIQPTRFGQKAWKKGRVLRKVGIRSYEVKSNRYMHLC